MIALAGPAYILFSLCCIQCHEVQRDIPSRVSEELLRWVQVTPYHPHNSVNLPRHLLHTTLYTPTYHPIYTRSFAYTLYNKRDNCASCLIQFEQRVAFGNEIPHHTTLLLSIPKDKQFYNMQWYLSVQQFLLLGPMINSIKCLFCIKKADVFRCVLITVKIHSLLECKYCYFCPMCLLETKLAVCSPDVPGESRQKDLLKYLGESFGNCSWSVIVNICRIIFALQ